ENVLKLFRAAEPEWTHPIPRPRIAHPQRCPVERREIEDPAPRPGARQAARGPGFDPPAGDKHRAGTWHGPRKTVEPRRAQVPMQASSTARNRSTGQRNALAFSMLRHEIAEPLDVVELDCAKTPARTREPAPDHPTLKRGRRAPESRAFEAAHCASASAPL